MSEPLPKRCATCGGKGFRKITDEDGTEREVTCTDCIGGTTGFIVFDD